MSRSKYIYKHAFSGDSNNAYGLEIVAASLRMCGWEVYDFEGNEQQAVYDQNPIAISIYWLEQIYDFIRWRKKYGIKKERIIVGGNTPTTTPSIFFPFNDRVYLGDGDYWDGESDDYIVTLEEGKPKPICVVDRLASVPYVDLQRAKRGFVEISRGCKNNCLFCQYGWLKPYREVDFVDIREQVLSLRQVKSIRLFAADRFQHSQFDKINSLMRRYGKHDTSSDITIKYVFKRPEILKYVKKARSGIEGMSYRLRLSVGKPYTDDQLVEFFKMLLKANIKSIAWYMNYGIPEETKDDWEEWKSLMYRLSAVVRKANIDYTPVIAIHWNAFTPSALTPYQWAKPAYEYPYDEFRKFHSQIRFDNLKLYHKPLLTSPKVVMLRLLAIRGSVETAQLVYNVALKPKLRDDPEAIRKLYYKITGQDIAGEWSEDKPLPWDDWVIYDKDKRLRIWRSVKKRMKSWS